MAELVRVDWMELVSSVFSAENEAFEIKIKIKIKFGKLRKRRGKGMGGWLSKNFKVIYLQRSYIQGFLMQAIVLAGYKREIAALGVVFEVLRDPPFRWGAH